MSRWDDAARHFQDAIALNERIGARPWLAHAQCDLGRALLTRARATDRAKAQLLLAESLTTYRKLGMSSYAAEASRLRDATDNPVPGGGGRR
jgi:hypothetical protein